MKKLLIMMMVPLSFCLGAGAQEKGHLTGSFETTDHVYVLDVANDFGESKIPTDRFGSNNYLKLDYFKGRFSAGMQVEAYLPSIIGYPGNLSKVAVSNLYADWKDEDFKVTAGTFYDQFGSGLLFRSWEDRLLGVNNALLGARFAYNWQDKVAVMALWGIPRLGMTLSDTQIRGADASVSVANLIGLDNLILSLEGSVLNRYESISFTQEEAGGKPNSVGWSGRLKFDYAGFFVNAEYVDAGRKLIDMTPRHGNAQLVELGYNGRGLGVTVTGRRLEWMAQSITANTDDPVIVQSPANLVSYIPAMCTQYTYMLMNLHPYAPVIGDSSSSMYGVSGEVGGQIDAFYNFRRGTALGGKRGMKIHANFSTYYTLASEGSYRPGILLFRDFCFDIEKQWTKEFKMVLMYSLQEYNPTHGIDPDTWLSNIFTADLLYKFTPRFSTRVELQYLTTRQDQKDWLAALIEVSFAPHWSIWGSDMYNHGSSRMHFYNAGVSYTKGRTRIALGYGRYREGMICSGGVCRKNPAYTGGNVAITTSF